MAPDRVAQIVFYAVIGCWFGFAAVFLARKRPPKKEETKRNRVASLGIFLQSLGYFTVWFWSRQRVSFRPIAPMPLGVEIALGVFAVAVAVGSVWLVLAAVRTLGKQWAIAARLVEGHKLITEGPYRWMRNPIYTGMFGMLLATGLAMSQWIALPAAIALFAIGTVVSGAQRRETAAGSVWRGIRAVHAAGTGGVAGDLLGIKVAPASRRQWTHRSKTRPVATGGRLGLGSSRKHGSY